MNLCKRDSMKSIINEPQNLSRMRGNINLLLSKEGIFPFSLINEPPSSHFMTETRNLPFSPHNSQITGKFTYFVVATNRIYVSKTSTGTSNNTKVGNREPPIPSPCTLKPDPAGPVPALLHTSSFSSPPGNC